MILGDSITDLLKLERALQQIRDSNGENTLLKASSNPFRSKISKAGTLSVLILTGVLPEKILSPILKDLEKEEVRPVAKRYLISCPACGVSTPQVGELLENGYIRCTRCFTTIAIPLVDERR